MGNYVSDDGGMHSCRGFRRVLSALSDNTLMLHCFMQENHCLFISSLFRSFFSHLNITQTYSKCNIKQSVSQT